VPTVRDRVLQTAVCQILVPIIDPLFEDESFAYRPGRSVPDAVAAVVAARDEGFVYVVDADIEAFFDNIPHEELLSTLSDVLPDQSVLPLVTRWLIGPVKTAEGFVKLTCGVPQGSPISPLLANLYLDPFDEAIAENENRRLVRYADDFVILARDVESAETALEEAALWLSAHGLQINFDKTRITHFDQGFNFLGVHFEGDQIWAEDPEAAPWVLPRRYQPERNAPQPRLKAKRSEARQKRQKLVSALADGAAPKAPPELQAPGGITFDESESTQTPLLRTLYLGEPGVFLRLDGGRLVVQKGDTELLSLPLEKVDQVIAAEEGAVSFGALRALMSRGAGFFLQGQAGHPPAHLISALDNRISLRSLQHERTRDAAFTLAIARSIVAAKIANSRLLLRRYYRFRPGGESPVDASMRELQSRALTAPDLDTLRGLEGNAARSYYSAWRELLPESWKPHFEGRNRQPPKDPVNAMLSYGYAVLYHNLLTLVAARGLEPHLGHLHAVRDGHPALVSDLVEEFRALVVDSTVLKLLLDRPCDPGEFELVGEGNRLSCRLRSSLRRILIERLEAKLNSRITHPVTQEAGDYRRMMRMQVAHYIQVLQGIAPVYRPFMPR
jgi:CRISPR-associated protein Cas1